MRIQGQVEEGVLINLLQYLNLNAATGVLRVQSSLGVRGEVFTEAGQVVHAATASHEGTHALVAILGFKGGRFAFQADVRSQRRSVDKPLEALLLEVAYETDQSPGLAQERVRADTVLAPISIPGGQQGKRVALPLVAIRLLPLLDGITPLGAVAARLGAELGEVLRAADLLLENDLAAFSEGRMLEAEFINNLTELARDIMGPLADIVIDDSLYELGFSAAAVPEARVSSLLELMEQEFPDQLRAAFRERVGALLRAHGLDRSR